MPTEFHKIMDSNTVGSANTFGFLDDITIVSTGSKEDQV